VCDGGEAGASATERDSGAEEEQQTTLAQRATEQGQTHTRRRAWYNVTELSLWANMMTKHVMSFLRSYAEL